MQDQPPEKRDEGQPSLMSGLMPGRGREYWDDRAYLDKYAGAFAGWNFFIGGGMLFIVACFALLNSLVRGNSGGVLFGTGMALPALTLLLARPVWALRNTGETGLGAASLHRMLSVISVTFIFSALFWNACGRCIHPGAAGWLGRAGYGFGALLAGLLAYRCWKELLQAVFTGRRDLIAFLTLVLSFALLGAVVYSGSAAERAAYGRQTAKKTWGESYETLAAKLASENKGDVSRALKTLEARLNIEHYQVPEGAVEPLLRALRGDDEAAAAYAAQALIAARLSDPEVRKALLAALDGGNKVGDRVYKALIRTGATVPDDIAAKLKTVSAASGPGRKDACRALARQRPSEEAAACLMDIYRRDPDLQSRREAAYAVAMMNYPVEKKMGLFSELVADPDDGSSLLPAGMLWNLKEKALPALDGMVKGLGAGSAEKDAMLVETLASFGPAAAPAAPKLAKMLAAPKASGELKCSVCAALGAIGPAAAPALPRLDAIAADGKHKCAAAAREALLKIRPGAH